MTGEDGDRMDGGAEPGELTPAGRRPGSRSLVGTLALLAVVAVAAVVVRGVPTATPAPAGGEVATADGEWTGPFAEPAEGDADAIWVRGSPVLLVKDRAGDVYAVEAVSPHAPLGIGVAVAWCPAAQVFVSMRYGDVFAADGRWASGPAPTGLATFAVQVGSDGVSIGDRREPAPRERPAPGVGTPEVSASDVSQGACLDEHVEPGGLVLHGWPPEQVTTPEVALAGGDVEGVMVAGRLAIGEGSARLCEVRSGQGSRRCRGNAIVVLGVVTDRTLEVHEGLWRVDVEDGALRSVMHVRTHLVQVGLDQPPPAPPPPPADSSLTDRLLTVYAFDLGYSLPPDAGVPAGRLRIRLDNRGNLPHTLVGDGVGVRLEAPPGETRLADVVLPPGEHVLYCDIPGHRAAGMEFSLRVME